MSPPPAAARAKARLVHFVGFRDDRYWNAVRVFGPPDMIHEAWDRYAADDTAPEDLVVLAEGEWDQPPRSFTVEAEMNRRARTYR
ncbi:hypothetical protein LY632_13225 [Erythrobacter sp. SDW2]|uniref:hypothetical protein n=1 Tax=Erythrobacter sp. SDW2 TaxID=2907154 RepID=UPI001F2802F7|nr:hypothetical protein [Erythrobacter sp. SDW2]UIP06629.1 hypothetical protein LY632_13225 [Erythrobacter sp. SDW2]